MSHFDHSEHPGLVFRATEIHVNHFHPCTWINSISLRCMFRGHSFESIIQLVSTFFWKYLLILLLLLQELLMV